MGRTTDRRLRDAAQVVLNAAHRFSKAPHRTAAKHARALLDALAELQDDEFAFLESRIRSWSDYGFPHWPQPKQGLLRRPVSAEVTSAATFLAAMEPNRYARQGAVERLDPADPAALRLCVIRTTDWVPQVAATAAARLHAVPAAELVHALPLIVLVSGRGRSTGLTALNLRFASESGRDALVEAALHTTGAVSRLAWIELIKRHPSAAVEHHAAALRHPDIRVRRWAVANIDTLTPIEHRAALDVLLRDPVGRLRAEALARLAAAGTLDTDDIAVHLDDRSGAMRAESQHWFRHAGGDPAAYYRNAIGRRPSKVTILGLAETGDAADAPLLETLLTGQPDTVRRAALLGLARLVPTRAIDVSLGLLGDPSTPVCRTVVTILRRARDRAGTIADLLLARIAREERSRVQRALMQAVSWSPWHRLAAAAELRDHHDDPTRLHARDLLDRWPSEIMRLGTRPHGVAAEVIERHLSDLDPELRRTVEYVIRTSR